MKIRLFEENDIKPIYELLKNELGYEVDYSLFVLRVEEMIKNNYLIYVACIENKVVGFIGIEVSYVFELPKQIMRVNALAVDKNYQNKVKKNANNSNQAMVSKATFLPPWIMISILFRISPTVTPVMVMPLTTTNIDSICI